MNPARLFLSCLCALALLRPVRSAVFVDPGLRAALTSILSTGWTEPGSPVLGPQVLLDATGRTSPFGGRGGHRSGSVKQKSLRRSPEALLATTRFV